MLRAGLTTGDTVLGITKFEMRPGDPTNEDDEDEMADNSEIEDRSFND